MSKLQDDFINAHRVFSNRQMKKQFRALLGHCYGRAFREPGGRRMYMTRSGQAFWEEITGDPDFYLKLVRAMREYPLDHRVEYETEWDKAVNRFEREFLNDFSTEDGGIDWEKLVRFNSGRTVTKQSGYTVREDQDDV